jgi:hypothetical protein
LRMTTILLPALLAPAFAAAAIVELTLDRSGRFEHSATLAPGKFVEVCGKLRAGDRLAWEFAAKGPLDFNVHYHEGTKIEFPEKHSEVSSLSGLFQAPVDQHYCWMWKNARASDVALTVRIGRP